MPEKEFNLLYEPWISVMRPNGKTEEVSMLEVFRHAPEWRGLAGELPTQDVAVLRLLLAVLHAVFARHDVDGEDSPIMRPSDARRRWKALWDKGCFPAEVIETYLRKYEERFYLFHPQYPFYQVAELEKATDYTSAKLNGEISESGHKIRLFPQRTGRDKQRLRYAEAARWLLYVNAFDDTSAKPKQKGLPSPGAGWLGKIGLITACGNNLFETLLLNLVMIKDSNKELWEAERPIWEEPVVKSGERTEITIPNNPSELLTLQSRRLLLRRDGEAVIGFSLLGGDFFQKGNAFTEQMTVWRNVTPKNASLPEYTPRRHDPSRQMWRDFSALIVQSQGARRPGIVNWMALLKSEDLLSKLYFRFQITGVKYGDKDFFIDDVFSDSISFNANLLTALGEKWVNRILAEIETSGRLAEQVGWLAQSLALAGGSDPDKSGEKRNQAKEQTYFQMDAPFRKWLEGIDPERDEKDEACDQWWKQAQKIARDLGRELVKQAGPQAFVGRSVKINRKESECSAPQAYNHFLYCTSAREALIFKKGRR